MQSCNSESVKSTSLDKISLMVQTALLRLQVPDPEPVMNYHITSIQQQMDSSGFGLIELKYLPQPQPLKKKNKRWPCMMIPMHVLSQLKGDHHLLQ